MNYREYKIEEINHTWTKKEYKVVDKDGCNCMPAGISFNDVEGAKRAIDVFILLAKNGKVDGNKFWVVLNVLEDEYIHALIAARDLVKENCDVKSVVVSVWLKDNSVIS